MERTCGVEHIIVIIHGVVNHLIIHDMTAKITHGVVEATIHRMVNSTSITCEVVKGWAHLRGVAISITHRVMLILLNGPTGSLFTPT
jgi:hypothetical protein